MKINKILKAIESPEFSSELGVVSTPRAFDQTMLQLAPVTDLLRLLENGEALERLIERTNILLNTQNPSKYRQPFDLPIAVYLRVLELAAPKFAYPIAMRVLAHRNFWWSRAIAMRVAAHPNVVVESTTEVARIIGAPVVRETANVAAHSSVLVEKIAPTFKGARDATTVTKAKEKTFQFRKGPGVVVTTLGAGGAP